MAIRKVVLTLAACLLFVLCNVVARATNPTSPTAINPVSAEPDIVLSLLDTDDKVTIWQGLRFQITVVSGSSLGGIGVESLNIAWPSRLALRDPEISTSHKSTNIVQEAFELEAGVRRELEPLELRSTLLTELRSGFFSILTYKPKKEVITATMEYRFLSTGKPDKRVVKLLVPVRAHPIGMYAGGVIGTFLAALFLVLPPIKKETTGAAGNPPASSHGDMFKGGVRNFFVRFARGAVVTGIVILTLQTTSDLALPINIVIQDFYGGVILGLFGDKVAETIQKWIWG